MKIFDVDAHVLIDTGSNHSFVSSGFARHSDKPLVPLVEELLVITPLGEHLIKETVYKSCEVKIGKVTLEADLIPLE